MAKKNRPMPEINAGSMADIAFLLLIFFLVTTTMDTDTGLRALLPPIPPKDIEVPPFNKRNVFEIRINSNNQMLVEGELRTSEELKELAVKFIDNHGRNPNLSDNPGKAVISIKNDRGTNYDIYVQVQNELRRAYTELRDKESQKRYGRNYDDLNQTEQKFVREVYPQKISEAEPEDIGGKR